MAFCIHCGNQVSDQAAVCPQCGHPRGVSPMSARGADKKLAAGITGILLGAFGIHKFILGYNNAGLIMLLATLLTCGAAGIVTGVIGIVEGIIYLTKSDDEFVAIYVEGERPWF